VFCIISISALDLEISIWRHVSPNALSTLQETYCSAETTDCQFRISHHFTYWQNGLVELLRYVITEKPYWKQLVLLGKWMLFFLSHSSANCWYYLSYFKHYLANRVLPKSVEMEFFLTEFIKLYPVLISYIDIKIMHHVKQRYINLVVRQLQLTLFSCYL